VIHDAVSDDKGAFLNKEIGCHAKVFLFYCWIEKPPPVASDCADTNISVKFVP